LNLGLPAVRPDRDCVWGQFTVFVDQREQVQAALKESGIPTTVHYPSPLHRQVAYAGFAPPRGCPQADLAAQRVLSLPMSADLTETDQDRVVAAMGRAVGRRA
jgi:UDP-2-acetamido-2-deoxy-ribo-hexuluronate aminotransferase